MKHEWLFIGGISRSGTTLMARLLSLHPECLITAECGWPLALWWGLTRPPSEYSMALWRANDGIERGARWLLPRLCQYDDPAENVRGMCDGYLDCLHPEVRVGGDKWPALGSLATPDGNERLWQLLRMLWPDCKLLFMHRPFEEAMASARRTWPNEDHTLRVRQTRERLEGEALCSDAYHVELENLNARPHEVMVDVLEFANLSAETYPWDKFDEYFQKGHRVN